MKILASDFDNTLYVENEEILKRNIKAVKEFISKGNIFCIITGRNYSNIKIELLKYNIPYSYLICQDGAKIFNNMDYCIQTEVLSSEKVLASQKILKGNNCEHYLDDGYNQTTNINDCVKVVGIPNSREEGLRILQELKKELDVYAYVSTEHINIIDIKVNKCNSLKKLLQLENLSKENLYVIGDEINDLEMLMTFKGAIMKKHNKVLNNLNKKEYENLYEYIEELSQI